MRERGGATATNDDAALAVLSDIGGGSEEAGGAVVAGSITAVLIALLLVAGAAALLAVAVTVVARQRRRAVQSEITMVALDLTGSHLQVARGVPIARDMAPTNIPPPPPAGSPGAPSANVCELPTSTLINPAFAASNPMAQANVQPEGCLGARLNPLRALSVKPAARNPSPCLLLSAKPPDGAQALKVSTSFRQV